MERGWREKDSGGAGKGGGEVGDDREGCSSVCRIRRWLTPTPRRRSLGRAMTSAKSPSLRLDESVAIKPIHAILCYPDWDDAKGVNATAEIMTRSQRIVG